MNKRAQAQDTTGPGIDPATQDYGTSRDVPGGTKVVKGAPIGVTGNGPANRKPAPVNHMGQKPPSMRGADFGVRIAMDTYSQGFIDKCASAGMDHDASCALLKQAINWGGMWNAAKPVLKTLNPVNLVKAPGQILGGEGKLSTLRHGWANRLVRRDPNLVNDLPGMKNQLDAIMHSNPRAHGIRQGIRQGYKNLAGGAASTAGIGGAAYGLTAPEPEPEPESPMERINASIAEYFKHRG